jgi:hypothetical protein
MLGAGRRPYIGSCWTRHNALTARWYDGSGPLCAEQSFTRGTPG